MYTLKSQRKQVFAHVSKTACTSNFIAYAIFVIVPLKKGNAVFKFARHAATIGPLQNPVTWYEINYAGTQITQWNFQNKGTRTSQARLSLF